MIRPTIDDRVLDYAGPDRPEFASWLAEVDALCQSATGLSIFDLADSCWCDAWESGVSPADAFAEFAETEGFSDLLE